MPRLTTRVKRRMGLTTSQRHRFWKGTQPRKHRMKSFPTKEKAEAWGKELGEGYELRQRPGGKWQWREK